MGIHTHVMVYSGSSAVEMGDGAGPLQFQGPLGMFNGGSNFSLLLYALPPGKGYTDVAGQPVLEYLQAAGHNASTITVDIRKPGGEQWGAQWVRYVIGHEGGVDEPVDVPIELPRGPEYVARSEVFDSLEAADIFLSYYDTGQIPDDYALRPIEGYTAAGDFIDLRKLDGE